MILLCIDTTKQKAVIALNNNGIKSVHEIPESKKHSEALLTELEEFLCKNKTTINDVTHLGAVTGPGSFTGIRIGMATIKAFSFALNLPIVSDNYFNVVSNFVQNGCVAIKNTSTSVYFSNITNGTASEIEVVNNSDVSTLANGKTLFVPDFEQLKDAISYNNISEIKNYGNILIDYLTLKVKNGDFTKSSEFSPTYAQLSQAERNLKN